MTRQRRQSDSMDRELGNSAFGVPWDQAMYEKSCSFYKVVPEKYNLLRADRKELDPYGIPEKPDAHTEPRLYEFWKRLVSPPFHAMRPTFGTVYRPHKKPHRKHPPASQTFGPQTLMGEGLRDCDFFWSRGGTSRSSLNWSGAIILSLIHI